MKEGDKRVHNNHFEQVEKCNTCGKLFWATSFLELGNWHINCLKCRIKLEKQQKEQEENIRKNGRPRYGSKGQIFAWTLDEECVFNFDYEPSERLNESKRFTEREIWVNGFIDVDNFERQFSEK